MSPPSLTDFATPWAFAGLILIPIIILYYFRRAQRQWSDFRYPSLSLIKQLPKTTIQRFRHLPAVLRWVALALLIVALARPQRTSSEEQISTEGIDIVLTLDISTSMAAMDFQPDNRLEAAKKVAAEFVDNRTSDRIGLVVFAAQSFTQCPLTLDYRVLKDLMSKVQMGMVEDGTAIGMAIANGVNRLRDSKAKSRVMILLTDGQNNRGELDPVTAAQTAAALGIKIYTIGVGTKGMAPYPQQTPFGTRTVQIPVNIDEDMLRQIATITHGRYFRATDTKELEQIYQEINRLEKSKIDVTHYRRVAELFYPYLALALLCLAVEAILVRTRFRKIP
jgi:Ca-activated chloride channel family protein